MYAALQGNNGRKHGLMMGMVLQSQMPRQHEIMEERTTGYDKIQKNDMWLLSMFDARHQNRYVNVDWVIARWMKRKRAGTKKESQICCGQFISKIAKEVQGVDKEVVRRLSALNYYRIWIRLTLDDLISTLMEKLILERSISRCTKRLIQRISLTGFPAQSVGSSNTDVLDTPCLLVLITGTSQSRQYGTDKTNITRKPSKTGKHEHGNQKSTKEAKDSKPKPRKVNYGQAQSKKVNSQVKDDNSSEVQHDGRVRFVKSSTLIGSFKLEGHVAMKKAQGEEIDHDPTAQNHDPMIGNLYGQDQKERVMQGRPRIFINWL
ncbi:hypothetical protein Tco_0798092 [Tanacetum coccineum]